MIGASVDGATGCSVEGGFAGLLWVVLSIVEVVNWYLMKMKGGVFSLKGRRDKWYRE